MLPLHPLTPTGASRGSRGPIRALVLTGLSMAILAAVVGPTADLVVLALTVIALGGAAMLVRRNRRAAATPMRAAVPTAALSPAGTEAATSDALTERLRALYDDHVEQVNMALEEGREDLAQELADSYMDQSLSLIVGGGHPSPDDVRVP